MLSNWDEYFYRVGLTIALNSKCFSRKIGALLVREKSIIATGYNGPPRGFPHCGKERLDADSLLRGKVGRLDGALDVCPRRLLQIPSGKGLEFCSAAHAERNCILDAARRGTRVEGSTLYLTTQMPCKDCAIEIVQAGIVEVVCADLSPYDYLGPLIFKECKIPVREFSFIETP